MIRIHETRGYALALLFLIITGNTTVQAQRDSTGVKSPAAVTSIPFSGHFRFDNADNAIVSDNNYASSTALLSLLHGETDYLQATNFGFSIPPTAIVCGIVAEIEKDVNGIGSVLGIELSYVSDHSVRLVRNGTMVGNNKASTAHWPDTESYHSYGGNTDIWGVAWTPADINSPDFGVAFSASITGLTMLLPNVRINHIRLTVYYYEGILAKELVHFNVSAKNNKTALVEWKTAGYENTGSYSVQRSRDGMQWETVSGGLQQLYVAGDHLFKMEDKQPYSGESYYRLMITEASGKKTYSATKAVSIYNNLQVKVFPNPFTDQVVVSNSNQDDIISLTDATGRSIRLPLLSANSSSQKLNLHDLKPGMYFLKIGREMFKLIRNKE